MSFSHKRQKQQKVIGVLGGASDVATMEYYRFLNAEVNARLGGWEIAETLIAGMNFAVVEKCVRHEDWETLNQYMGHKIESLTRAGADVILCVSNTLHQFLPELMRDAPIPFIHIARPTGAAIQNKGLKRVALFGTRPVMERAYMRDVYEKEFGLEIITPSSIEADDIDGIIFDELVKGIIKTSSKRRFIDIAKRLQTEAHAQGVILGCTEIFLLLDAGDIDNFPMFNTAKLHCDAAVEFALHS